MGHYKGWVMKHVPIEVWSDATPLEQHSETNDRHIARLTNLVLASLGVSVFAAIMSLVAAITGLFAVWPK
ncbi:MAG: hypothetical protein WAM77_30180 [Xanthobacteraceae bacterium]